MNIHESQQRCAAWSTLRAVLCAAVLLVVRVSQAQNYSIDWFTIDGGGGTSTGGVFAVNGTIGQPDSGNANGMEYALDGGFWSIFATPTLGVPSLVIMPAGLGMATISWNPNTPGFVLQMNHDVENPATWSDSPSGNANPTTVTTSGDKKFFRLRKP